MEEGYLMGYPNKRVINCVGRSLYPRSGIGLAVWLALAIHPARAAEEVWPVEPASASVTALPVQMPVVPTYEGVPVPQLAPAESYYSMDEPMPPGEGPDALDAAAMGSTDREEANFWTPTVHVGATVGITFDDNIFITNSDTVSDTTIVTSARATLAFGNVETWAARFIDTTARALSADQEAGGENLIALTYAPTAEFFFDNDSLNTVNHDVAGTVRWGFSKLRVGLDGRFQTLSDPDPDLGRRSDRDLITGHIQASYDWTEKSTWEANLDYQGRNYDVGQDSTQLEADAFFLYQALPKTQLGFGLATGVLDLDGGGSQNFQQALLRVRYDSFSKISANATLGAELRQSSGDNDETNGVFQVGVNYQATETTQFYVSAYQRTDPSPDGDSQSIQRTSFALGLDQRILQFLLFGASAEYSLGDFAQTGDDPARTDRLLSLSVALTFEITQYGFVRLNYSHVQNDSDLVTNSYNSNRISLSLTALF